MNDLLEQIGLLRRSTLELKIPIETFQLQLANYVGREEVKMFGEPNSVYHGRVTREKFKITENIKGVSFGELIKFANNDSSDAQINGIIIETENGLEIQLTSFLFKSREILFLLSGSMVTIAGIIMTIGKSENNDSIAMIVMGVFVLGFTYLYMRKSAIDAIRNFRKRFEVLQ